jgi:CAAX prenyl protease-like protein
MKTAPAFPWKLFWVLLAAALVGVLAAMPMLFEMIDQFVPPDEQQDLPGELPLPVPLLVLAALVQNGVIFGAAIAVGLVLAPRIGTGAPLLASRFGGEILPKRPPRLARAAVIGFVLGTILALVDAVVFLPNVPAVIAKLGQVIPLWKRLLAGFLYGGVAEELLMRLFLFSLVAWLLGKLWASADGRPTAGAFWMANLLVAVLFALGHLPATQLLAPLTTLIIVRSLVLNGVASATFGWLFWRRGLEAAMVAHACAHLGLQVLGPMFSLNS